jgi:hypothetical protein
MVSQTNEKALEALMEKALSGISREALQEQVGSIDTVALAQASQYRTETGHGYQLGGASALQENSVIRNCRITAANGAKHRHTIKHPYGNTRSTPVWH